MKRMLVGVIIALCTLGLAQPFVYPENYAPSAKLGGTIQETTFGDFTSFNIITSQGSATEIVAIGMFSQPGLIYRDWLGNRTFKNDTGDAYNLNFAAAIEEVQQEQEFIITLKEGWKWSDGTPMTADDIVVGAKIIADPESESNYFTCAVLDDEPVLYEKLDTYKLRILFPKPKVNALFGACPGVPAHIFGPAYDSGGAEGVKALWGIDTPIEQIVSGGPYKIKEYRPGERLVMEKNPVYGEFTQAADGTPLPGPDEWIITITADNNAELALCSTGQCSFYYPDTLDEVAAMQEAVTNGTIAGEFYPEIGPGSFTDYMFFNFNNTDTCKREMFRNTTFRQAINAMIDRQALIDAALGGLGVPGYDYNSEAAAPFDAPALRDQPFEFNPEKGVELLGSIGFTEMGEDGVLTNPSTGCRAEFNIQWNAGNNRRAQEALVMSQTVAEYGVKINPTEVSVEVWGDSWSGNALPRAHDFDAQIGALVGGDIDNPSGPNVFRIASNLNGWNKSKADAQPWEILVDRLTGQMEGEFDLDKRIAIYEERAGILREQLALIPLLSPSFHFYHNMSNTFPLEAMDSNSIQSPYNPGGLRDALALPTTE
jgi:peptide/nickel transport system substrate-binding protein